MTAGTTGSAVAGAGGREVRPHLEGLRGLAVLAVLLFHLELPAARGGFAGVDVFFVLSGFLITGLLVREHERTGSIDLRAFYARRMRRILPAALVTVVATVAAAAVLLPPLDVPPITLDGAAAALSIGNIRFAIEATDYFGGSTPSPFRHYWSLGVEEQFYLLWPAFLILAWRFLPARARASRARLGAFIASALLLSFLLEVGTTLVSVPWAFYSLPTRAWQLALGGLLALVAGWFGGRSSWLVAPLGILGIAGVVASFVLLDGRAAYPGVAALLPVLAAGAVIVGGDRPPVSLVLGLRPVRWLGRISYSLYLWHWPILVIPAIALGRELAPAEAAGLGLLSLAVAALSWRFVEEPFRRGWSPAMPQRRTLVAGVAAMATAAVLAVSVGDAVLWRLDAMASSADAAGGSAVEDGAVAAADGAGRAAADTAGDVAVPAGAPSGAGGSGGAGGSAEPGVEPTSGSRTDGGLAATLADPGGAASLGSSGRGGSVPSVRAGDSTTGATAGRFGEPTGTLSAATPSSPAVPSAAPSAAPPPVAPSATPAAGAATVPLPRDVRPRLTAARDDSDPLVRDGCGLSIGGSDPPSCVYGRTDGSVTVALVGDSHAEQWFPALERLADERGWRLLPFTKHSCPFVDLRIYSTYLGREYTECEAWRPKVVAALQAARPDLVVVTSHRWFPTIVAGDSDATRQGQAMARLLEQLPGRVVLLADTPVSRVDVPACLSAHLRDIAACETGRLQAFGADRAVRERTASRLTGAPLVDLSDILCPGTMCPVVIDDMIVLRDDHHLTATFAASLADVLAERLPPIP